MGNVRILADDIVELATTTLTASAATADNPVTYAAVQNPIAPWSTGTISGTQSLTIDQGANRKARTWDMLAVAGANLTPVRNLLRHAAVPTDAVWTKSNVTIADTATVDPNDDVEAHRVTESSDGVGTKHSWEQSRAKPAAALQVCGGFRLRDDERFKVSVELEGASASDKAAVRFDLQTLAVDNELSAGNFGTPTGLISQTGDWITVGVEVETDASATLKVRCVLLNDAGTINYVGDGSSGLYVYDGFAVLGSTLPSEIVHTGASGGALYRLHAARTVAGLASPSYDSGWTWWAAADDLSTWPETNRHLVLGTAQSLRVAKLEVEDPHNADGTLLFPRVMLGESFSPGINREWDLSLGYQGNGRGASLEGGQEYPAAHRVPRSYDMELRALTRAEAYGTILDILRRRGEHRGVYVVDDPDDATYPQELSVYGRLVRRQPIIQRRGLLSSDSTIHTHRWHLQEWLP